MHIVEFGEAIDEHNASGFIVVVGVSVCDVKDVVIEKNVETVKTVIMFGNGNLISALVRSFFGRSGGNMKFSNFARVISE